ncbi:MAG: hypothetical protein RR246_06290 [Clostridia bacterium]
MFVKQLSIFVENKLGRLSEIIGAIAQSKIDIRAMSMADTTNFGILRLIVDKPDAAEKALREMGLTVKLTEVIAIEIPDVPGGFAAALDVLTESKVTIEYSYAFISRVEGSACVILRVDNNKKAIEAFAKSKIKIIPGEKIYSM